MEKDVLLVNDFEMIQIAKDGDLTALEQWMSIHSRKIEQFSFQYGVSLAKAYEVTLETFIELHRETISNDRVPLNLDIYKSIIEKLDQLQMSNTVVEHHVFPFDEDAELHSEIVNLHKKLRVPFILSLFHDLSNEQIALILDSSAVEVESSIQSAKNILSGDHLEKRVKLLGKSYERLPLQFNPEQIIGETVRSENNGNKTRKRTGRMIVMASVFLIGILSVLFLL